MTMALILAAWVLQDGAIEIQPTAGNGFRLTLITSDGPDVAVDRVVKATEETCGADRVPSKGMTMIAEVRGKPKRHQITHIFTCNPRAGN